MDLRGSSSLYASGSRVSNIPPAPLRRKRYEKTLSAIDCMGTTSSEIFQRTPNLLLSILVVHLDRSTGESGGRGKGRDASDEGKSKCKLHCFCQILDLGIVTGLVGRQPCFFWLKPAVEPSCSLSTKCVRAYFCSTGCVRFAILYYVVAIDVSHTFEILHIHRP
jgi:hypothetical protein